MYQTTTNSKCGAPDEGRLDAHGERDVTDDVENLVDREQLLAERLDELVLALGARRQEIEKRRHVTTRRVVVAAR